ncbi:fimbria/pilus outer membrane usher protein [Serratia fonticola]|uniref:fimbria/pilus outer membrane usher protein n=1 Tax=Serratia fonticola TaxID=47917 RepID=UPI001376D799|nr:fimbria/pilus outer membrane usher protein [Serratia fonticola]NCG54505.1 fimbria/pilus outer membrane usher protein [Serratia fonticola]
MKQHTRNLPCVPRRPRLSLLVSSLLLSGALPAWGRDYFDPGLLSLHGSPSTAVDLSAFETAGQIPEGSYLVTVYVNQSEKGQQTVVFDRAANGEVQPVLTPSFLREMGVNTDALPAFAGLPPEEPVSSLTALIPDAQVRFALAELRLDLSIPQVAMQPSAFGQVDPALWDPGVPALLLNYTLNGGRNWQSSQAGRDSSEQTNLFANVRTGANLGSWRLRSDVTHTRYEYSGGGQPNQSNHNTQFMNTYVQRDIQRWRSEILAGESSSGSDVFDSIPFRGVKLNSNEDMLPYSLRGFAPLISGIAQSNARVTVSQNGNVVYQTFVAPGPFVLDDLSQTGQGGDLLVTITEADGTVRTQTVAYSSLPMMLRPGALKYEVTAGRYNGGVTQTSRESTFGLGTLMMGLPYDITLYGGSLVAQDYLSMVVGSGVSLRSLGALSADVTTSSATLPGQAGRQHGASYRVRYAKSLLDTGTSIDLAAYRYSTRHYYSFSDVNSLGYQLSDGQVPWALDRRRSSFQLRLSQQLGRWGAAYLTASRDDYWGGGRVNNTLSAGYNGSYRGVSYGVAYSIDRIKGDGNWPENRQLSVNVQVPFSLFSTGSVARRSYANYQLTRDNQGRVRQQVGVSGNLLENSQLSYSALQGWSNGDDSNSASLNAGYQGSKGRVNLGYSYASQYRSLNLGASGGLVVHPEGVTLSQSLGNTVAIVSAPGAGGVGVTHGGIRTDSRGYAVVPYLSDYQKNSISLNPTTLPDDVDITQSSLNVYPTKGAVVMASFSPRIGYQALVTLRKGNTPVPFGALVTVADAPQADTQPGIVGDGGQAYLSGLPASGRLRVVWGPDADQRCEAVFSLTETAPSKSHPVRQLQVRCEETAS